MFSFHHSGKFSFDTMLTFRRPGILEEISKESGLGLEGGVYGIGLWHRMISEIRGRTVRC